MLQELLLRIRSLWVVRFPVDHVMHGSDQETCEEPVDRQMGDAASSREVTVSPVPGIRNPHPDTNGGFFLTFCDAIIATTPLNGIQTTKSDSPHKVPGLLRQESGYTHMQMIRSLDLHTTGDRLALVHQTRAGNVTIRNYQ